MPTRALVRKAAAAVALLCLLALESSHAIQSGARLPDRLTDREFWALSASLSEPGGTFSGSPENFVSNERSYQIVLDELAAGRRPASAYVGVGPEQNFTYILALAPRIAFIVDIRRQNLVHHLMYKALFELSASRAEFLGRLFSRAPAHPVGRDATIEALVDAFDEGPPDLDAFYRGLLAVRGRLMTTRGFPLTRADELSLEHVLRAFADAGPNLTYAGPRTTVRTVFPTFGEVMLETDQAGNRRHFLASDANYQAIRALHLKNLIVPVVGDFSGPKALRGVGDYLRRHDATVTAFYTSNVEQYLFMGQGWQPFYANVGTLPLAPASVFIRGMIRAADGQYSASPAMPPTSRYDTRLFSIPDLIARFNAGAVRTYYDAIDAPAPAPPATMPAIIMR